MKTKKSISLILDDEFVQFCELNKIEDVEKLAKETFKRGFDLLKYGNLPEGELTSEDKGKLRSEKILPVIPLSPPTGEGIKSTMVGYTSSPKIVEAIPLKSSNAADEFSKMGVITKNKDLYGE